MNKRMLYTCTRAGCVRDLPAVGWLHHSLAGPASSHPGGDIEPDAGDFGAKPDGRRSGLGGEGTVFSACVLLAAAAADGTAAQTMPPTTPSLTTTTAGENDLQKKKKFAQGMACSC